MNKIRIIPIEHILCTALLMALPMAAHAGNPSVNNNSSVASSIPLSVQPQVMEKCYGVVKSGRNDCDTNNGPASCMKSAIDSDPNYWVYVPKGVCEKIVGGIPESSTRMDAVPGSNQPSNQYLNNTDADMRQDLKKGPDMGITSADDLSTDNEVDPNVVNVPIDAATH